MKISLKWLNSYLDRPTSAEEAERVLTDAGFPLDGVEKHGEDSVLDVEVTSNRVDCLSHIGVARELAAATGRVLQEPSVPLPNGGKPAQTLASVQNEDLKLCPLYTARVITGVKVAASPRWLAERLEAVGLRPVNNVVDVTNYLLHEMGQPLHAFDLAKLDGRQIVVRRAAADESFTAIDGSKHKLRADMLVIADGSKPQAVAGVMGGLTSEVGVGTTDVLLESARFDPLNIRSTSRSLKLASDSSYRFERGVDPTGVERASLRAAAMIVELAGGTLADGVIAVGEQPPCPHKVSLRPKRCCDLLGVEIATQRILELLGSLGLKPRASGDRIECEIPTYRQDLKREVDLIEEVARLHGLAKIPVKPRMEIVVRPPQTRVRGRGEVARVLTAHGFFEAVTFSFIAPKLAAPFADGAELLKVDEEKKKAEAALRPSVLPSLLSCRKSNQDAGNKHVRLFEVAQVFSQRDGRYAEHRQLAMLADAESPAAAMREMRGTVEELLETMGLGGKVKFVGSDSPISWAAPTARIVDAAHHLREIGRYGPATPAIQKLFDLQTPVVLAELDYDSLLAAYPGQPRVGALPKFPAIERDLSLVVDESLSWESVEAIVEKVKPALMERLEFVTVYRGKPVPTGRKSVTLRMTFRDPIRTLLHDEVSEQVNSVVAAMTKELNAELRTT